MEDLKALSTGNSNEDETFTVLGKKRISYVSRDLKSMIDFVAVIYQNLGHTEYHPNKTIAKEHGLSPDSIKQQLTSSQQYRLLEMKHGTGYKITDHFKKLFLPLNDAEKRSAVIESLKSPDTYSDLFKQYENHVLPPVKGLKNHFVRNFHYKEDIAEKAAEVFINNLKEYRLLDSRQVLTTATNINDNTEVREIKREEKPPAKQENNAELNHYKLVQETEKEDVLDIIIPLKSKPGRVVHLLLPKDYTEEDLDRVAKFVEALK